MGNIYHKDLTGTDLHIPKIHQINDTAAHTGTPAAVTGDIVVFDANGLPADSGNVLPNGTTATTQSAGDNSTKVATTAYVDYAQIKYTFVSNPNPITDLTVANMGTFIIAGGVSPTRAASEHLRVRHAGRQRRLLASLAEVGSKRPSWWWRPKTRPTATW